MIVLKPYDVFIFSDGRPFNKGENLFREGRFFLNPIPILSFANKLSGEKLNIQFISLIKKDTLYFKVPIEIKKLKYKEKTVIPKLKKLSQPVISKYTLEYILEYPSQEKMEDLNSYIDVNDFIKYLKGESLESVDDKKLIVHSEIRTGIEIDRKKRTTVEGMLYTQVYTRFSEDTGFFVKFNKDINTNFFILGGEGKLFNVEKSKDYTKTIEEVKEHIKQKVKQSKIFKVVLLTPTNNIPEIEGSKLIAKVIGKHITYSGWLSYYKDKIKEKVLPTRIFRLIPEGSVFYYKLEDENKLDEIFQKYWLKPAFFTKEYPYFDVNRPSGFGLSVIGTIKNQEDIL
ncbi:type III-B CRISPR module-associated Cmr3 family protein [Sulfurihydrogenibium sp.]|uniref:type III-B CRISPR module-associated Cmr3 family protein n=1 Tax=Sulfurihydrogenibium sp. TaxID=2053621 RepID=UPI002609F72F|nr:type III-B CRISPR module-associated Cmr3 family protein [Sulfurihydrogenibium sp.]